MVTAFTKLKGFVQTYAGFEMNQLTDSGQDELKAFVSETIQQIKWEIGEELDRLVTEADKDQYIKSFQEQLAYLAEGSNGFEAGGSVNSSTADFVLAQIFEVLEHLRVYFKKYFNFNAHLPGRFILVYKGAYSLLEEVKAALPMLKGADPELIQLLENYIAATDTSERFKIRTWRQWDYFLNTFTLLAAFIKKVPKGETNLELLKIFLCRDFNSIHVYAYFLKYFERITSGDYSFLEQEERLLYLLKVFKQVRVETKELYDPNVQSLKDSVLDSLTAEIKYIEDKEKLVKQAFKSEAGAGKGSRFYFTVMVTLAELMFFFRILLEVGFMQTKFNSYLYEFIGNHIRTQRADNISKKSMRNHFSNQPFPDRLVQNVRSWLSKMISHIDLYYKS